MNWRCFFGIHKWGKWLDGVQKVKYDYESEWRNINIQVRYCQSCNLKKKRDLL